MAPADLDDPRACGVHDDDDHEDHEERGDARVEIVVEDQLLELGHLGGGQAAPAEAELLNPEGPRFVLKPPSRSGLLAKKNFERERLEKWFRE